MLELKKLNKSYEGKIILDNINLDIKSGEIIAILGPSGCGKTTLINLILGITQPNSGKIIFNNIDITNLPMEKKDLILCFKIMHFFPI